MILQYLTAREAVQLGSCSRGCRALTIDSQLLWHEFCYRDFHSEVSSGALHRRRHNQSSAAAAADGAPLSSVQSADLRSADFQSVCPSDSTQAATPCVGSLGDDTPPAALEHTPLGDRRAPVRPRAGGSDHLGDDAFVATIRSCRFLSRLVERGAVQPHAQQQRYNSTMVGAFPASPTRNPAAVAPMFSKAAEGAAAADANGTPPAPTGAPKLIPLRRRANEPWSLAYKRLAADEAVRLRRLATVHSYCGVCDSFSCEIKYYNRNSMNVFKLRSCGTCGAVTVLESSTGDMRMKIEPE